MLGVRGLDFQIKLTETVIHIPIIFMCESAVRYCRLEPLEANRNNAERSRAVHPRTVRAVWAMTGRPLKLINFI